MTPKTGIADWDITAQHVQLAREWEHPVHFTIRVPLECNEHVLTPEIHIRVSKFPETPQPGDRVRFLLPGFSSRLRMMDSDGGVRGVGRIATFIVEDTSDPNWVKIVYKR